MHASTQRGRHTTQRKLENRDVLRIEYSAPRSLQADDAVAVRGAHRRLRMPLTALRICEGTPVAPTYRWAYIGRRNMQSDAASVRRVSGEAVAPALKEVEMEVLADRP